MQIDGKKLPLNNFVQETIDNIMAGFSKSLKGMIKPEDNRNKNYAATQPLDVDAPF